MARDSYPIPGDILNANDFFGLGYEQLLALGAIPLIVMMFSVISGLIPLWVSIALGVVTAGVSLVVVVKAPDGQDPFEWTAAAFKRRFSTTKYTLQPVTRGRAPSYIQDTIHTADNLGHPSEPFANTDEQQPTSEPDS